LHANDFTVLANAVSKNRTIQNLDLSYNNINDSFAQSFRKMIVAHTQWRNDIVWLSGLRGIKPSSSLNRSGLFVISLAYNRISDEFAEELSKALKIDNYITVVDLRNNSITEKGVDFLLNILVEDNTKLINLDLRDNPGFVPKSKTKLIQKLERNISKLKKDKEFYKIITENNWINTELLRGSKRKKAKSVSRAKNKEVANTQANTPLPYKKKRLNAKDVSNKREESENNCESCKFYEKEMEKAKSKYMNIIVENQKMQKLLQTYQTTATITNDNSKSIRILSPMAQSGETDIVIIHISIKYYH